MTEQAELLQKLKALQELLGSAHDLGPIIGVAVTLYRSGSDYQIQLTHGAPGDYFLKWYELLDEPTVELYPHRDPLLRRDTNSMACDVKGRYHGASIHVFGATNNSDVLAKLRALQESTS